jgi:hypothetical protein
MSSTSHPVSLSIRHECVTECKKLKSTSSSSDVWHNIHTKFLEFPSSHSLVNEFAQTDVRCEQIRLGWFRSGCIRLVMRMRRGSWLMASTSHLASLSIHHDCKTERKQLKSLSFEK